MNYGMNVVEKLSRRYNVPNDGILYALKSGTPLICKVYEYVLQIETANTELKKLGTSYKDVLNSHLKKLSMIEYHRN